MPLKTHEREQLKLRTEIAELHLIPKISIRSAPQWTRIFSRLQSIFVWHQTGLFWGPPLWKHFFLPCINAAELSPPKYIYLAETKLSCLCSLWTWFAPPLSRPTGTARADPPGPTRPDRPARTTQNQNGACNQSKLKDTHSMRTSQAHVKLLGAF